MVALLVSNHESVGGGHRTFVSMPTLAQPAPHPGGRVVQGGGVWGGGDCEVARNSVETSSFEEPLKAEWLRVSDGPGHGRRWSGFYKFPFSLVWRFGLPAGWVKVLCIFFAFFFHR